MKKILSILFIIMLMLSITACDASDASSESEESTTNLTTASSAETEPATEYRRPHPIDLETVTYNTDYDLDNLMVEELIACQSNVDIANTFGKYKDEWIKLIDEYYSAIQAYDNSKRFEHLASPINADLASLIKIEQEEWEANVETELRFIKDYNICLFGAGSGASPNFARMVCEFYRERALELYSYCTDFRIECTAP